MTLESWKENGWLRPHNTSKQEARGILELVERDLADASSIEISKDWRFNIAYNAGLQLSTLVLYAAGTISHKEGEDLLQTVTEFKVEVETWLRQNHPNIFP